EEPGAVRVDYDSPVFEAAGRLVNELGTLAYFRPTAPELKEIDPAWELERALRLHNGIFRIQECVRAETVYVGFIMQYDAMADERSGGLFEIWVNPESRSITTLPSLLDIAEGPRGGGDPPPAELAGIARQAWSLAQSVAVSMIAKRITGFCESQK